jgi:titin
VQYSSNNGTSWSNTINTNSTSTSYTVTGLTANTSYVFKIAAYNAAGASSYSTVSNAALVYGVPGIPTGVAGTGGRNSTTITWTAPSSNGSAITDYKVQYSTDGVNYTVPVLIGSTVPSYSLSGLTGGSNYYFKVAAVNAAGTGTFSAASAAVVPYDVPPTTWSVTASGADHGILASWLVVGTGGSPITSYNVQYSGDGGTTWSNTIDTGSTTNQFVITGLTVGASYVFRVRGVNAIGAGGWSAASAAAVAYAAPDAPANVVATSGLLSATITWDAPNSNYNAITQYLLRYSTDGGITWSAANFGPSGVATTYNYSSLNASYTYIFQVEARNAAGWSAFSAASNSVSPYNIPDITTGVVTTPGIKQMALSWTAPAANNKPITGYLLQSSTNGGVSWSTAISTGNTSTSYTFTGLTANTLYNFRVAAVNDAGTGTYSATSAGARPYDLPSAPTAVTGTAGNQQVALSWTAASGNGATVTNHYVQYSSDGGTTWSNPISTGSASASYTVTGLSNSVSYIFQVAAYNAAGTGPFSASSASYTPFGVTAAPTSVVGTSGNASVSLAWTDPATNGAAITNHYYQLSTNGGTTWGAAVSMGTSATSFTVSSLTNGTSYVFRVATVNAAGTSAYSTASTAVVPATTPAQPSAPAATVGNTTASVTWAAPANNGSAITGYSVQYSTDSGSTWTGISGGVVSASPASLTGLTNGSTYVFRVAAINGVGTGAYSAASTGVIPYTVPDAPTSVSATAGFGSAALTWTAPFNQGRAISNYYVQYSSNSGTTWSAATVTGTTTTSYTMSGLSANTTYIFKVAAVNIAGTSTYSSSSNSVTVYGLPGTPTGVTTSAGQSQVTVSWSVPSGNSSAISSYSLQYSTNSGVSWSSVITTGSSATSYVASVTANGSSYIFKVAATNAAGTGSYSTASSGATPYDVPSVPTSVAGTAGSSSASLTWTSSQANGSAITSYQVQYSSDGGTTWSNSLSTGSSTASYSVTGLTVGTTYVFRVAATNSVGTGGWSLTSSSVTPYGPPLAPTGVVATAGVGQATLTWTAPSNNGNAITNYSIQNSTDGGSTWSAATLTGSTSTSKTVTGLTAGTAIVFRVAAINAAGTGTYSSATDPINPYSVPAAPTAVTATAGLLQATVSWTAGNSNGSTITNYYVQYSSNSGSTWSTATSTGSSSTSYTVTGLTAAASYIFKVAAVNTAGTGAYSSNSSTVTVYNVPSAPTGVQGTIGDQQVALTWTAGSTNGSAITNYYVQYSSDGGVTWSSPVATNSSSATFTVTGLTATTSYIFQVAAYNAGGTGSFSSSSASLAPYGKPVPPATVAGTLGNASVALTWDPSVSNGLTVTNYYVQYSSNSGSSWSAGLSVGSAATSYTVTGLTNGTSYLFRVAGVNSAGTGTYSAATDAVVPATLPSAVGAPVGTANDSSIYLTWTAPANNGAVITDYNIQYSSNGGGTWISYTDGISALTSATVSGLTNGTSYVFRIAAVNIVGAGSYGSASTGVIPVAVAGAPTSVLGQGANNSVALAWSPPANNGGSAITDYLIQYSTDSGSSWSTFSHTASFAAYATVTGLTNGTPYEFRLAAINVAGTGAWSSVSSSVIPYTVAGAPTGVTAVPGDSQVVLSWTAPTNNGGNAITDYAVEYSTNSGTTWITYVDGASSAVGATVTGLTNGTGYIFRISAVNAAGTGTASASSSSTVPRTMPTAVQALAGTPGDSQMTLTWSLPASSGGSAITDYIVQYSDDSGVSWSTFADGVSTTRSAIVTGLINGAGYTFRVAAVNVAGTGSYSLVTNSIAPYTTPGVPQTLAANASNAQVALSWNAPGSTGGNAISDYTVQYSSNSGVTWTTWTHNASSMSSATVTGLINGTTYVFRVAAVNAAGASAYTSASSPVTPITVATAASVTSVVPSDTQVAVTWTAPLSDGGSVITNYLVAASADNGATWGSGESVGSTSTSYTMSGLTNGTTYVFRVAAVNAAGIGVWGSASAVATPRTVSNAPTDVVGTTGNAQVSLVWSEPTWNGGSAVTDYTVQYSSDGGSTYTTFNDGASSSRAATVTGLTNGTSYVFRVAAVNIAGVSAWSADSASVIPRTVPSPPTITSISAGNAMLTVSFNAGDSGGNTITGYQYSTDNGVTWQNRALGTTESPVVITTMSVDGTTSLANGTTYWVLLRALNAAGIGSASSAASATPLTIATAPTGVNSVAGAASADVAWTAPLSDGGATISNYQIQYSSDNGSTWSTFSHAVSSATTITVTGLTNGVAYIFRVAAINSEGTGPWSLLSQSVTPRTTPSAPTNLVVNPANASLDVSWTAPDSGGSVITDYTVEWSSNGGNTWSTYARSASTSTNLLMGNLSNGTAYVVRVSAVNIAGTGSSVTSSSSVTPRTVPSAPTLSLATPGDGAVSIPFSFNWNGGSSVTSLQYSTDSGSTWSTASSMTSPLSISGLTNGVSYSVRLRAVNAAGDGAASLAVSSTPRTAPGAPSVSSVTPGNTSATVVFTQPFDGGSAVTNYEFSTDGGSTWQSSGVSASPVVISGLTNGSTYSVKIRAVNVAGTGSASTATSIVPFTSPGAPTISQASGGIGQVAMTIVAGSTNGSTITNYEYSTDNGATWTTRSPVSTAGSLTVSSLADGTRYGMRVRAVNAAGSGAASDVVYVSTRGVPSSPTIVSFTESHAALGLTVSPGANGGDPITNYQYSTDNGSTWVTRTPASSNPYISISGLSDGTVYQVKVRAVNGVGAGDASSATSMKPRTVASSPVLNTQVDPGDRTLHITFTAGFDGGVAITDYEYSTDRGATWYARTDGGGTSTAMVITRLSSDGTTQLTNGTVYNVQIRAVNSVGSGAASNEVTGTPKTTPDAPVITQISKYDKSLLVAFTPMSNGGAPITGYEYSTDGGTTWVGAGSSSSPITINALSTDGTSALVNGTSYMVQLRALNSQGRGTATSSVPATPRTTPGAPSITSVIPGDQQIVVNFTPGITGGSAITYYEYSTDGGASWRTRAIGSSMVSSPITITKESADGLTTLVNGRSYDVLVRAVNVAGFGTESVTTSVIPSGTPSAPTISSITRLDTRLEVAFTSGGSNGSAILSNQYSIDGGNTWVTAASLSSPITITGLTNGTSYPVQVRHVNANGTGSASTTLAGVPRRRPDAPSITSATMGNRTLTVTYSAPANGGDAVTTYEYSTDGGTTWQARSFGSIETTMVISTLSSDGTTALTNGASYVVKVRAVNGAGSGPASDGQQLVPYTVPSAPYVTSVGGADSGADVVYLLSWDGGNAVSSIDYSLDGGATWNVTHSTQNPLHISGLANGSSYSVVLRAVNNAGASVASNTRSVAPSSSPAVSRINNLVPGNGTLRIEFTPGFDNGATITGYEYSVDGGTTWHTATMANPTAITVNGLQNGTLYSARIRALNSNGAGSPSDAIISKPYTVPSQPTNASALALTNSITVSYSPPVSDGGQQITGYEYSIDGGSSWVGTNSSVATDIVITNIADTTNRTVRLRAVSAAGAGDPAVVQAVAPQQPISNQVVQLPAPAQTPTAVTPTKKKSKAVKPTTPTKGAAVAVAPKVPDLSPAKVFGVVGTRRTTVTQVQRDPYTTQLTAGQTSVWITARSDAKTRSALGTFGEVVLVRSMMADIGAKGFAPNSTIEVWIHSTALKFGDFTTDATGSLKQSVQIPSTVTLGQHTLEFRGTDTDGKSSVVAVGVVVRDPQKDSASHKTNHKPAHKSESGNSVPMVALLIGAMSLLLTLLALLLRRKRATA